MIRMILSEIEKDIIVVSNNIRFRDSLLDFRLIESGRVKPGDIGLFEVMSDDGGYTEQLELDGTKVRIHRGDYLIGVFGIRQSGTSISGDIPSQGFETRKGAEFQILSSSTIVGYARRVPSRIHKENKPIELRLEAIVANEEGIVRNIRDLTPYNIADNYRGNTPIVLVLGSSAECGKTTTASALIKGFVERGLSVAACKTNGSGNIRDKYSMWDAGAQFYLDFVDFGLVTTYSLPPEEYLRVIKGLLMEAERAEPDVFILECGGDVMWGSIPPLLSDPEISPNFVVGVMCSTGYMAAYGAYRFVREQGVGIPILFNTPIDKEGYYRREYFEELVNSVVYDVMDSTGRGSLVDRVFGIVQKKNERTKNLR